jgi:hypothetical protein
VRRLGLLLLLTLASCTPPESERRRGEAGADVGNHGVPLEVHGATDPLRGTPERGRAR